MSDHTRKRSRSRLRSLENGTPRRGVYLIPNLLTSAGLFCGVFSIVQTMDSHFNTAALAILAAHVFDGLDGRVARMTNTTSRFGVEYDSMCDLVSFGVAPALLIYQWALIPWELWGWSAVALFITCAAARLARFNVLAGHIDANFFMGLPVPAAATMLASIVLMYRFVGRSGLPDKAVALLLLTYALAILMVSTLSYPSFKKMQLHRRQPMSAFVGALVLLAVAVASYQVFIFGAISIYVASGPLLWVRRTFGPAQAIEAEAAAGGTDSGSGQSVG
ncbi:MAG: CDP-diacylglycerol--serine O-phosphatidyltransferase [Hyphomicrobiaceae bacterium]|jgi:CDP-diacylglycerol--serine O-phosphatidyltransferase